MTEQPHGWYFAEELVLEQGSQTRKQIQDVLDVGEGRKWHLVGVPDILPEHRVVLFLGHHQTKLRQDLRIAILVSASEEPMCRPIHPTADREGTSEPYETEMGGSLATRALFG